MTRYHPLPATPGNPIACSFWHTKIEKAQADSERRTRYHCRICDLLTYCKLKSLLRSIENQHFTSSLNSILHTVSYACTLTSTCNCYQQVNQKPISDSCFQTGATYTKSMLNPSRMGKHPRHTTILCSPCFPSMTDNIWSPRSA